MMIKAKVKLLNPNSVFCTDKAADGKDAFIVGFGEFKQGLQPSTSAVCVIELDGKKVLREFDLWDLEIIDNFTDK